jgi:hypothetical protein
MIRNQPSPTLPSVLAIAGFDSRIPAKFFNGIDSITELLERAEALPKIVYQAYRDISGVLGKYVVLTGNNTMPKNDESLLFCIRELAGFDTRIPQSVYKTTYNKDRSGFYEIITAFSNEIALEYLQIENALKVQIFTEATGS